MQKQFLFQALDRHNPFNNSSKTDGFLFCYRAPSAAAKELLSPRSGVFFDHYVLTCAKVNGLVRLRAN